MGSVGFIHVRNREHVEGARKLHVFRANTELLMKNNNKKKKQQPFVSGGKSKESCWYLSSFLTERA